MKWNLLKYNTVINRFQLMCSFLFLQVILDRSACIGKRCKHNDVSDLLLHWARWFLCWRRLLWLLWWHGLFLWVIELGKCAQYLYLFSLRPRFNGLWTTFKEVQSLTGFLYTFLYEMSIFSLYFNKGKEHWKILIRVRNIEKF